MKQVCTRLSDVEYAQLKAVAKQRRTSMAQVIREDLALLLATEKKYGPLRPTPKKHAY
jgi:hypothetical protein